VKVAGLVRALIVDDSRTARLALRAVLESEAGLCVVGEAEGGPEALARARSLKPDIVLMDVYLRDHNGLDVAAELMSTSPCPILAVTAANPTDPALVFRGMEVGVLDIALKPPAPDSPGYEEARRRLTRLVKALARVPVVHRFTSARAAPRPAPVPAPPTVPGLLALGASTGGPPVVKAILELLPPPFPLPVVLVQHMTTGFGHGFAKWLADVTRHRVVVVEGAQALEPGVVYVAHDDRHLRLATPRTLAPDDAGPVRHQRPSIDVLFESVARHLGGATTLAALLTGMGDDGARGLLALREAGAVTIAQAPASCVVDSMPSEAIARGAALRVLAPGEIATAAQQHALSAVTARRPTT